MFSAIQIEGSIFPAMPEWLEIGTPLLSAEISSWVAVRRI